MTMAMAWANLRDAVGQAERNGMVAGVSAVSPAGAWFDHGASRRFIAASTVKIPLLIELFRQVDAGDLSLAETYRLREADKVGGSGVLSGLGDGLSLTLADLAYLMMSVSDNTATNVLIDRVGLAQVQATMRALGMHGSTLLHIMRGRHVDDPACENWAIPREYAAVVRTLLDDTAALVESCRAMIGLMRQQQNDRRIARHLSIADRLVWGSKTGSLPGIINDVGFIMTQDGPIVLALFLENVPDAHTGEATIGDMARSALDDLYSFNNGRVS